MNIQKLESPSVDACESALQGAIGARRVIALAHLTVEDERIILGAARRSGASIHGRWAAKSSNPMQMVRAERGEKLAVARAWVAGCYSVVELVTRKTALDCGDSGLKLPVLLDDGGVMQEIEKLDALRLARLKNQLATKVDEHAKALTDCEAIGRERVRLTNAVFQLEQSIERFARVSR